MSNLQKTLHLYIDESGNFDFEETGTEHFILTILCSREPAVIQEPLSVLYSKISLNTEPPLKLAACGFFHASEDRQAVRNEVVGVINNTNGHIRIDSVIARKKYVSNYLRSNHHELYYKMGAAALKYASNRAGWQGYTSLQITFGHLFHGKKKREISEAFKRILDGQSLRYSLQFSPPDNNFCSQIVDYFGWALYRKYERGDTRTYDQLKHWIVTEWSIY